MALIDQQAAIDAIKKEYSICFDKYESGLELALKLIETLPPVQPERKKGEWINGGRIIRCNKCKIGYAAVKGMKSALTYNFCPNCGADMRGEADDQ